MNAWVKKSIEVANGAGYLDRLFEVYPLEVGDLREIPEEVLKEVKLAFDGKNKSELIKLLLKKLDLFPIKDSYVASLRRNPGALDLNPQTVERIGSRLLRMGFDEVMKASTQPKETNRQIGPLFHRWLPKLGYPVLGEDEFFKYDGIAFLGGTDNDLKNFANEYLGAKLTKGLDAFFRVNDRFVIGEAKFLTDFGGHQNAQLNDALNLSRGKRGKVTRIAILDGVVWMSTGKNKMNEIVRNEEGIIMSALLLGKFIDSLKPPQK